VVDAFIDLLRADGLIPQAVPAVAADAAAAGSSPASA